MMALHWGRWLVAAALLLSGWRVFAVEVVDIVDRTGLAERVQRLERIVEGQGLANLLLLVEQLQTEARRLQGEVQELRHEIEGLENQQRELYRDLDRRLQQLSQVEENLPPIPAEKTAEDATAEMGLVVAVDPGEKAYRAAFELLKERRYREAITAFSQFLQQYPESSYRADVQYWLGETYYVLRDSSAAAAAFQSLIEQYPKSTKIPDALLKQGLIYYELEQWEQARVKFQEAIARLPDSTVSRLAEEHLDRMKREGHI